MAWVGSQLGYSDPRQVADLFQAPLYCGGNHSLEKMGAERQTRTRSQFTRVTGLALAETRTQALGSSFALCLARSYLGKCPFFAVPILRSLG